MNVLEDLKTHLTPGQVYRRSQLEKWSNAVDRHLKLLLLSGVLQKMSQGLYYCPKKASFGEVPPEDEELVRSFLKSDEFLLTTPNLYNSLGLGTTQLYNKRVVYNHKRHGKFVLGGREFDFRLKHKFPAQLTKEFLLVDLLNNLNELAEDKREVLEKFMQKLQELKNEDFLNTFNYYAGERTKKLLSNYLNSETMAHAS